MIQGFKGWHARVLADGFPATGVLVGSLGAFDRTTGNKRRGGGEGAAGPDEIRDSQYSGCIVFHLTM